jgi:hypothetical protein
VEKMPAENEQSKSSFPRLNGEKIQLNGAVQKAISANPCQSELFKVQ